MQTTEQRLERMAKHNRRLTTALTLTVVAMCAVVTVAATGEKDGYFDTLIAKSLVVVGTDNKPRIYLKSYEDAGAIVIQAPNGKPTIMMGSKIKQKDRDRNVHRCTIFTSDANSGKRLIELNHDPFGGLLYVNSTNGPDSYEVSTIGAEENRGGFFKISNSRA